MVKQGFSIGDSDWYVMCYYNADISHDGEELFMTLVASGCDEHVARSAMSVLENMNSGYTFSNLSERCSIVIVSKACCGEQFYDTVQHELSHVVDHICESYDVSCHGEIAAHIQGEVARNMYEAVSIAVGDYSDDDVKHAVHTGSKYRVSMRCGK